ncbi:MAG: glycosyltransferase family 2 protein [Leptolyngbyaceae cyanobacterium]
MNPLSRPLVSVVICPNHCDRQGHGNPSRALMQAIDSVCAQTLTDWELLVIDDGSTDIVLGQMQQHGDRFPGPQLRYIRQRSQGLVVARNYGLQLARGEAIAFLDSTAQFVPTHLEQLWAVLTAQAELGLVHSGWQRINGTGEDGIKVMPWHHCPTLDLAGWLQGSPLLLSAMLFRRKWLFQADGFNLQLPGAEDWDLVLRLAAMGCQATWLWQATVGDRSPSPPLIKYALERGRSRSTLIDQLFARSDLPVKVTRNENQIRSRLWIWFAWELYQSGQPAAMVDYLKQSWHYSHRPPVDSIITWVEAFAEFSRQWGQPLDTPQLCNSPEWQGLTQWCVDVFSNPQH